MMSDIISILLATFLLFNGIAEQSFVKEAAALLSTDDMQQIDCVLAGSRAAKQFCQYLTRRGSIPNQAGTLRSIRSPLADLKSESYYTTELKNLLPKMEPDLELSSANSGGGKLQASNINEEMALLGGLQGLNMKFLDEGSNIGSRWQPMRGKRTLFPQYNLRETINEETISK